jgi:crotonobetainyl-CoA:carnitine CoA-transferase CaiB-like acyl-CoA transferase
MPANAAPDSGGACPTLPEQAGPLGDLVVVDLTRALAGPHAAQMLGDLGATVIKIESPGTGDDSRTWGPPFVGSSEQRDATYFLCANRNKLSVTADLKSTAGRDLLTRLVRHADVLCENFRPGVLDRLGFPVSRLHQLNPRLVIMSITGFGHDGPDGGRAGYDQIAQGEAGLMSLTGSGPDHPTKVGVPIADLLAGMNGAFGVLAALHERERTGVGRVARTSLLASTVGVHAFQGTRWTVGREVPQAIGNHHPSIAPYGLFRTADAPIQVACGSQGLWQRFAGAIGLDPSDERFRTNADRVGHREQLADAIETLLSHSSADHWLAQLTDAGVPCGKVRTLDDVYAWHQTLSQGLLIEVDHPVAGRMKLPGPAIRFDDLPYAGGREHHLPPPRLGEHNAAVADWLDALDDLHAPDRPSDDDVDSRLG